MVGVVDYLKESDNLESCPGQSEEEPVPQQTVGASLAGHHSASLLRQPAGRQPHWTLAGLDLQEISLLEEQQEANL